MSTSAVPAAIDALLTALRASSALADPVQVLDGPLLAGDYPADVVIVGWDGDDETDQPAAAETQTWAGLGAHAKDAQIAVSCAVISWSGDTDVKTRRDRAYTLLGAVEDALRSTSGLDLGLGPPTVFALTDASLFQEQGSWGLRARIPFTVTISTRI